MVPPQIHFIKTSSIYVAFQHHYTTRRYFYYKTISCLFQKRFLLKMYLLFLGIITMYLPIVILTSDLPPCISLLCYRFLLSVIITDFFSFDNSLFGTKKCPLYSKSDGRYCLKNHLGKSFILILYMLK